MIEVAKAPGRDAPTPLRLGARVDAVTYDRWKKAGETHGVTIGALMTAINPVSLPVEVLEAARSEDRRRKAAKAKKIRRTRRRARARE